MTNKCIIPKKRCDIMSHRFLCVYIYRLNGNVDGLFCKDRANPVFGICTLRRYGRIKIIHINFFAFPIT